MIKKEEVVSSLSLLKCTYMIIKYIICFPSLILIYLWCVHLINWTIKIKIHSLFCPAVYFNLLFSVVVVDGVSDVVVTVVDEVVVVAVVVVSAIGAYHEQFNYMFSVVKK